MNLNVAGENHEEKETNTEIIDFRSLKLNLKCRKMVDQEILNWGGGGFHCTICNEKITCLCEELVK
jgi:hypothetical protein